MSDTAYPSPDVDVDAMTPTALQEAIDVGEAVPILDVRVESEFEKWHIEGNEVDVVNIPYYDFFDGVTDEHLDQIPTGEPLIVVCAKGDASAYVAGLLIEAGRDAVNLEGGMEGWAGIYEHRELETGPHAAVIQYHRPSSGCLAYLVIGDDEAAVVDPLWAFADEYASTAREYGAELTYAIDTHIHADHVSGVRLVAEQTGAALVLPTAAVERGVTYDIDVSLEDGEILSVGESEIEAIHTPGHTTGMTSLLVDGRVLLSGDGLFLESVARPDLERGDEGTTEFAAQLHETLHERILPLPDETIVAPAHVNATTRPKPDGSYTATLGELTDRMESLHMDVDEFVTFIGSDMPPRPSNYQDIIAINLGQRDADDEEAFRLELGPNNCAATTDTPADD